MANQLAASKIFHSIAVLPCPANILSELQDKLVDFVWFNKRHLLKRQILFELPFKGGLGLANLQARSLTFRFNLIQQYLQPNSHSCFNFMDYNLRRYKKMKMDYQLFLLDIDPHYFTSLSVFYSEVLRAWMTLGARIETPPINQPCLQSSPYSPVLYP